MVDLAFADPAPNFLATYVQARNAGIQDATQTARRNALAQVDTNPDAARVGLMKTGDFQGANAVDTYHTGEELKGALRSYATDPGAARAAAFNTGDPTTIDAVSRLDASQRAIAQQKAQTLAAVGFKLKQIAPATDPDFLSKRQAALQALGPSLNAQFGISPDQLAKFTPTDENIDAQIASAQSLHDLIEQNKPVTVSEGQHLMTPQGKDLASVPKPITLKDAFGNEHLGVVDNGQPGSLQPAGASAPAGPTGAAAAAPQPRSIRNNNPGNIEDGPFAKSRPGYKGSDGRYAIFTDPQAGQNAQVSLLQSYGHRGLNTVQAVVNRWAPPSENDSGAYAATVAKSLGVAPDQPLNMNDPHTLGALAAAMAHVEAGKHAAALATPPQPQPQAEAQSGPHFREIYSTAAQGGPGGGQLYGAANGVTGEDFLKTLPNGYAQYVKAIARGDAATPTGFVMKTPYGQKLMSDVEQYDPSASAVNLPTRLATRKAFVAGGGPTSPRGQLASINTVSSHLATLYDAIDGLRNFSGIGVGLNRPANALASYTDKDYQDARSKYDAALAAVSSDLPTVLRGGAGAERDVQDWRKVFDPNKSPDALKKAVQTTANDLVQARITPLREQYQQGMGTTEDPFQTFYPEGAAALARIMGATPAAAATRHVGSSQAPPTPKPGTVQQGYRFNGGDPASPHNWVKVQ